MRGKSFLPPVCSITSLLKYIYLCSLSRPKIWSLAQTATSEGPSYRLAPGSEWATSQHLPDGANVGVDMYTVRHPGDSCGLSASNRCVSRPEHWPDETGISLLSAPISSSGYHQQKAALSTASRLTYQTSFSNTTTAAHLVSGVNENFSSFPPPHPNSMALMNGASRSAPDLRHANSNTNISPEASLSPMYGEQSSLDSARTNTFLGRVFSDYISAGQGMELNGECERGLGSFADDTPSPPESRCMDLVKRGDNMSVYSNVGSAFQRPLKR